MKKHLLLALLCAFGLQTAQAADPGHYGIICYHDIIDTSKPEDAGAVRRQYFPQTLTADRLIAHFNWLRDNGYTPVSWQQIKDARAGKAKLPNKPVLLTFDDGYLSFYTTAYPILKAFNYPAVYALITSWLEIPADGRIQYDDTTSLPRSAFVTWEQVREMQASGLIEIASHTHDLHHGIKGNPGGSQFAAVFPGHYQNGRYETPEEYRKRIYNDLKTSRDTITRRTGIKPEVLVWPYGQFTLTSVDIARDVGFQSDLTLSDETLNPIGKQSVGRMLADQESSLERLQSYLSGKRFQLPHQRAVYVKLDELYHPDPVQQDKNYNKLIQRMFQLGANAVYLQAVTDENKDGTADAAYFPNRHLPLKADLFSQVAWQIRTRSNAEVRAWMPMLAFDLGSGYEYLTDSRTGKPTARAVKRLSPFNAKNRKAINEIYEDLSFNSRFNGLAFGDDGFITEYEAPNHGSDAQKTDALIGFSKELTESVLKYSFNGRDNMTTVRGILPEAVMPSEKPTPLAQNLAKFAQTYNQASVTAPAASEQQFSSLLQNLKATGIPAQKLIVNLQARQPDGSVLLDGDTLAARIMQARKDRFTGIAYSTDGFTGNQPDLKTVKPVFAIR